MSIGVIKFLNEFCDRKIVSLDELVNVLSSDIDMYVIYNNFILTPLPGSSELI